MKFKHFILATLLVLVVTGCAQWNAIKVAGAATTQKAADEALQVVLWQLCKASSIGSINRWIAGDQELASAYNVICNRSKQADVIAADG